jgi:hypothetical protein
MVRRWARAGVGCALLWVAACGGVPTEGASEATQEALHPGARDEGSEPRRCDRSEVQQLEDEARRLAVAGPCEDVSQCRAAPVGVQACGGPRDYLVYCATATDERELQRALARLARREERFNRQCDVFSICIFLTEPAVELVDGVCRVAQPPVNTLP